MQTKPTGFTNEAIMQSTNQDEESQSISVNGWSRNNFDLQRKSPTAFEPQKMLQKLMNEQIPQQSPFQGQSKTKQVSFAKNSPQSVRKGNSIRSNKTRSVESETTSTVMPETCSVKVNMKNANEDIKQYIIKGQKQGSLSPYTKQTFIQNELGGSIINEQQDQIQHDKVKIAHFKPDLKLDHHDIEQPQQPLNFIPQSTLRTQDAFSFPANIGDTIDSPTRFNNKQSQENTSKAVDVEMNVDIQILRDTKKYVQNEYDSDLEMQRRNSQEIINSQKMPASQIQSNVVQGTSASFRANSGMHLRESELMKSLGSPLLSNSKKNASPSKSPQITKQFSIEYNDLQDPTNQLIGPTDQKMTPKNIAEESKEATRQVQTSDVCNSPLHSEYIKNPTAFDSKQSSAQRKVMYQTKGNNSRKPSQNQIQELKEVSCEKQELTRPRLQYSQVSPGAETIGMQDLGSKDSEEATNTPLSPQRFDKQEISLAKDSQEQLNKIKIIQNDSHAQIPSNQVNQNQTNLEESQLLKPTKICTPKVSSSPPKAVPKLNLQKLEDKVPNANTARCNQFVSIGQLISDSQIASVITTYRGQNYSQIQSNQSKQGQQFQADERLGAKLKANSTLEQQKAAESQFSIQEFDRQFQATIKNMRKDDQPYKFQKHQSFWNQKAVKNQSKIQFKAGKPGNQIMNLTNSNFTAYGSKLPAAIDNPLQVLHTRDMISHLNVPKKAREDFQNYQKKLAKVKTSFCQNSNQVGFAKAKPQSILSSDKTMDQNSIIQIQGQSKKMNHTLLESVRHEQEIEKAPVAMKEEYQIKIPNQISNIVSQTVTPQQQSQEDINLMNLNLQPTALQNQKSPQTTREIVIQKMKMISPTDEIPQHLFLKEINEV